MTVTSSGTTFLTLARALDPPLLSVHARSLIPFCLSSFFLPLPPPSRRRRHLLLLRDLARSFSLSLSLVTRPPLVLDTNEIRRRIRNAIRGSPCAKRDTNYALRARIREKYSLPGLSSCFPRFLVIQLRRGGRAWLVRVYTCIYGLP